MFRAYRFTQLLVVVVVTAVALSSAGAQAAYARNNATTAVTWHVAPTGLDANSCMTVDAPCLTINGAIGKATAGDAIEVAMGTYTPASDAVVTITKNLTLSGGWSPDFASQTGMSTIDGLAAFRGVTINDGLTVTIDHFVIQHGSDAWQGAGINNRGNLTLTNSIVTNNSSGWMGGGIDVYGTLMVNNSTISNNSAGNGGSGGGGGGAIEVAGSESTATLNNTTLSSNQIIGYYSGSAIDSSGTVFLNNSTISGNTGAFALEAFIGQIILNNSTVVGNSGGIDNYMGTVSLRNSILSGNLTSGTPADCTGSIGSAGYNLIGIKNSGCTFTAGTGDKVGTVALPLDPMLGPLADNGGPTFTHALTSGSPAIGAGNPADPGSGADACLATDQRGTPRLPLPDGGCDMGAYEFPRPYVTSITRAGPNPTASGTVDFTVTFSEAVTGVNAVAPFSDFGLRYTGVTGVSIVGVSGSANIYTVTVATGSGNGSISLNVKDDDSIIDSSSNPLGGPGTENGSFTSGQTYTISKMPVPQSPSGTIWDTTPTYKWSKVPQATQYRYQLVTGTTPVYAKVVPASVCSATVCSSTPTTLLAPDAYKWRVQALLGGVWKSYSPYRVFVLRAPKAGYYKRSYSDYAVDFYVTPNRVSVRNFGLWFYVGGCHKSYKLTNRALLPINNIGNFSFTGPFHATGTFTATTLRNPVRGDGGVGLDSYYIPGCGNVSGSVAWTASWINGTQPAAAGIEGPGRFIVTPMLDAPSELLTIGTFTLQP